MKTNLKIKSDDGVRHKDEPRGGDSGGIKTAIVDALNPMKGELTDFRKELDRVAGLLKGAPEGSPIPAALDALKSKAEWLEKTIGEKDSATRELVAGLKSRLDGLEAAAQAPGMGTKAQETMGEIVHKSDAYQNRWSKGTFGDPKADKVKMDRSLLFGADGQRIGSKTAPTLGSTELTYFGQPVYRPGIVMQERGVFGVASRLNYVPMPGAETYIVRKETAASRHGYVKNMINGAGAAAAGTTPVSTLVLDSTAGFVAGTYVRVLNTAGTSLLIRLKISAVETDGVTLTFATGAVNVNVADNSIVVGENFGATAESGTKPYGYLAVTQDSHALKTLAVLYAITEQRLKSAPGLTTYLQTQMQMRARENLSWHVLYGDSTVSGQLAGFASETTAQTYLWSTGGTGASAIPGDNQVDAIVRARSMIIGSGQCSVVMNTLDFYNQILLLKGTDGHYLRSAVYGKIPLTLVGSQWMIMDMPIVLDDAVRPLDWFVIDFARASEFVDQQSDSLGFGYVNAQYAQNEITARHEMAVLHAITNTSAYVFGQWDAAPSAV